MKFRPCIDIHNGQVKQIVGASLQDKGDKAAENFVSSKNAAEYARLYKEKGLTGGHIILLNPKDSSYYEKTLQQAEEALKEFPGGMQIGGGVNPDNAKAFLDMGASHVIVTSYVFKNGQINLDNLKKLTDLVGKKHLVLDLSCKCKDGEYYIVTDRWQNFTDVKLNEETFAMLGKYCDEFLIHAADVEGKKGGIDENVAEILGSWGEIPMTYAGGIGSREDIDSLRRAGKGRLDFTIGSALDIFGGTMSFEEISGMSF